MRFKTIWTVNAMAFKERLRRTRDWVAQEVAARLPLRIRFWVAIQMMAEATMDSKDVPATPLDEVLKKLNRPSIVT